MTRTAVAVALAFAVPSLAEQPAAAQNPAAATTVNSLGMRMVLIPAGTFTMGSAVDAPMHQDEERPHRVTLTRPFRLSATEVTQGQWLALMPASHGLQQGTDLPVASITWADASEFCLRLSQKEKALYRLPTEAEWEYACRASADESAGSVELSAIAWFADDSDGAAHAVATKRPNAWGLFDMLGNVAEWTQDVHAPYAREGGQTDPAGPTTGATRVVRGGSWRSFRPALRCAARTGTPESYQLAHLGFRVAQQVE